MTTVVIAASGVIDTPDVGGHFWVYMQYIRGLQQMGCDVYWLEAYPSKGDQRRRDALRSSFLARMEQFGLAGKVLLYTRRDDGARDDYDFDGMTAAEAGSVFRRADLLLNFRYSTDSALLSRFRRTALVDIDPGLLQFWMSVGQIHVPEHDLYFTTGETVGTPAARFPDCGLDWIHIRPPVSLASWQQVYTPDAEAFTTVSSWWGGSADGKEWVTDGKDICYDNNKRISFLEFAALPRYTSQVLELALYFGQTDGGDQAILESNGWHVRHSRDVAGSPQMYQAYVQNSRGEFSCAKPSCMRFQNAWISDRTLCYLASGKPAVVQHTGPSSFLPNGEGLFRFSTMEEAVDALARVNADYERNCRAAREIAHAYFDAKRIAEQILNAAL